MNARSALRPRAASAAVVGLLVVLSAPAIAGAQGHGPVYGLSTPTLGRGGWSLDVATMGRVVGDRAAWMVRPMVSYGVTEDLQLSLSLPVPVYTRADVRPGRGTARMPANPDAEILLGWRFQRRALGVGSRFESTAYVGLDYPTDCERAGLATAPGLYGAAVTGYASRTAYAWVGALYRRSLAPVGAADRPGDLAMASVVVGYRPPPFRKDYPHPDWRLFLELLGEWAGEDGVGGAEDAGSGGRQLFAGPTVLGLYGSWGISGGPLFRVRREPEGEGGGDRVRFVVNLTYWF